MGFAADPLAFTPRKHCGWNHRFDDPAKNYRTLYAAQERTTCLRETLADLRPNAKAIADFRRLFGKRPDAVGEVTREWLEVHVLTAGRITVREGQILSADDLDLRRLFKRRHAELLAEHGMEHFDITEVRSRNRIVTQTFGRFLFARGAAGILYHSNLDNLPCLALFETRATLTRDGEPEALSDLPDELFQVCKELGLVCSAGR